MSWEALAPRAPTSGKSLVNMRTRLMKDGSVSCYVAFSSFIQDDFKEPLKARVEVGRDNHAGAVRFTFGDGGEFDAKAFDKGGFGLTMPMIEGAPAATTAASPCKIVEKNIGAGILVVMLPEEWERLAAAAKTKASATPPNPTGGGGIHPQSRSHNPGRPLDAVEYLTGKGVKCSRLALGKFALEGDTVTKGQIVKLINDYRKAADLDPLSAEAVD